MRICSRFSCTKRRVSRHFVVPKQNSAWWAEKIADNRKRDATRAELRDRGWVVIRLWKHDIHGDLVAVAAARIARTVRRRLKRGAS
jgi:DNA mismatch endonuclease, patch repair protein